MKRLTLSKQKQSSDDLLAQLLASAPRPSRRQRFLSFLSHGAWQGIGGIFGILSFIVTIFLTVYIFNLGQQQQTAELSTSVTYLNEAGLGRWRAGIDIYNNGPAKVDGLILYVERKHSFVVIEKCRNEELDRNRIGAIAPSSYQSTEDFGICVATYANTILPSQSTSYRFYFHVPPEIDKRLITAFQRDTGDAEETKKAMNELFLIRITGSNIHVDEEYK